MPESAWWLGLTTDHLYPQCPGRQRSLPELARAGWDTQGQGTVDPLGTDICGWCRRVWLARNPQPAVVTVELAAAVIAVAAGITTRTTVAA